MIYHGVFITCDIGLTCNRFNSTCAISAQSLVPFASDPTNTSDHSPTSRPNQSSMPCAVAGGFFIFIFFKNVFYRNIFSISHFTVLYPYRPAGGGRDLHINKHKFFCEEAPGGSLPPPCRAASTCRPVEGRQAARPPGRGAAGSPQI